MLLAKPTDPRFDDLTGRTFARLTVIEYAGRDVNTLWLCRCSCGTEKVVRSSKLKTGSWGRLADNFQAFLSLPTVGLRIGEAG